MTSNPGSFYTLEMQVAPGGCRRGDCFVLTDLEVLKRIVTKDLARGIGVYLLAWYGEDILVSVYTPGEEPRRIDLLPCIAVALPGYPGFAFTDGQCTFDFEADEEELGDDEQALSTKLFCDAIKPVVTIDWQAAAIPPLPEPMLPEGAEARIHASYGGRDRMAIFGHNDFEGGDHLGTRHVAFRP
jgi:hypothetical protein